MKTILFACVLSLVIGATAYASTCSDLQNIATAGVNSLQSKFWKNGYFVDGWPSGNKEHYWTYAMALDAVTDAVEFESKRGNWGRWNFLTEAYNAISGQKSDWYDDEAWMAAVSARIYHLAQRKGDTNMANKCKNNIVMLFNDIHAAWDTSCCGDFKAAVWWDRKHTQKATASTGGAIVTAMHLKNITGDGTLLSFAWQVNNPWVEHMVLSNGQVCDHISTNGQKECGWLFTYNQGIMIGAATMISADIGTSNPTQWNQAKNYVKFLLDRETKQGQWGKVLNDGDGNQCKGDCQEFKAPTSRYLRMFVEVGRRLYPGDKDLIDQALAALKGSAYSIANTAYNSRDSTFSVSWQGPSPPNNGPVTQFMQNAAIQGLYSYLALCQ